MANSKIIIEFNSVPGIGKSIYFDQENVTFQKFIAESFVAKRLGSFQTQVPKLLYDEVLGESRYVGYISDFYRTAFNLDYNTSNLFMVESIPGPIDSGLGTVIITANFPNAIFDDAHSSADITFTIENEPLLPDFNITNVSFGQNSTMPCQKVKVTVATDHLASKVISPVKISPNLNNPFSFEWLRGDNVNLVVEDSNGQQSSKSLMLPSLLNASNFIINVNSSPNGATVVIENINTSGLELEYSLNNSTWQSLNTFSGLDIGNFTLYVRDQLGCSFSKTFSVSEFGIQVPYFYISKSNAIRYANRITWRDSTNYKTDENTLSYEVDVDVPYKEVQQFQSADIVPTQFKSNYSNIVAKIIKEDLSETTIPIEKKTTNIGIKDKRDARKYNLGDGRTGIYFLSGNTYNYETNAVTGNYSLNGNLPEWAINGNYIIVGTSWFIIEEIIFDETKGADVVIFSERYTGPEINLVVGSIFNRFNYEVYEYYIDMVDYIDQHFSVQLVNSDLNFGTITHLSEEIWCKVRHEDVVEIKYRNTTNTDIFYATGIEFIIRVPLTIQKGVPDEDSEIHKTDTDTILLTAALYEGDQFIFEPSTKEIWRKNMIALSHEKVWLNGVGYVKNGSFSTEGPLEKSNLYVLTANMLKTGNIYNSQGSGGIDFDGSQVEVPGLISTESGYVRY